jgi:predicted  nucleic acid-binding Zn-ribbon protein
VSETQSLQARHNTVNLELQSIRTKIKNSENRLYSGKVTNPKELSDLQGEIESLGRRASIVEDEVLELLILLEDAETEKAAAAEALATAEARWVTEAVELESEKNELALRLNKLLASREAQARIIDAASLEEYDQLMKKKRGMAIARVRGVMCLGCRVNISANKLKLAQEGVKEYCGGCGRIIFPY